MKGEKIINSKIVREDFKLMQEMAGLSQKEREQLQLSCFIFVVCERLQPPVQSNDKIYRLGLCFFTYCIPEESFIKPAFSLGCQLAGKLNLKKKKRVLTFPKQNLTQSKSY